MSSYCVQRIKVMGFTRSDPKMRRMAMYAASLATIGFVGGALIGSSWRAQDDSRGSAISNPSSVEQGQQLREDGLLQPSAVGPVPVDAPALERPSPDALSVDALPDAPDGVLRRAVELFRKGDMAGGE